MMREHPNRKTRASRIRLTALVLALAAAVLSGCGATAVVTKSGGASGNSATGLYKPGEYKAEKNGFGGPIQVTVTVSADKIKNVVVKGDQETQGVGSVAVEKLPKAIVAANGTAVEAVSGASVSSKAILAAVEECLAAAKGVSTKVAEVHMKPGTYTASARGFSQVELLPVTVTVSEDKILDIAVDPSDNGETEVILRSAIDKLIPRILEHQSVAVDSITGATASSSAIKSAVETVLVKALKEGGSDPSAINAFYDVPAKRSGPPQTIDVDLLVVGMGGTGIMAAVSAAETMHAATNAPVSILAIDKAGKFGGQSAVAAEPFGLNPKRYCAEFNNGKNYVDVEKLRTKWLEYTMGSDGKQRAKTDVLDMYFRESGETIDWLHYDHGFEFGPPYASGFDKDAIYLCKFKYLANDIPYEKRRNALDSWYRAMVDGYEKMGGRYMLETEGYEFLYDKATDSVVGAKARNLVDGTEYVIHAKAVFMGTGGFGSNGEMTTKYYGSKYYPLKGKYHIWGMSHQDGKMVQAAIDIGAGTYNIDMPPITHNAATPIQIHDFKVNVVEGKINNRTSRPQTWSINDIPNVMAISCNILAVDRFGKRFTNEFSIGNASPAMPAGDSIKAGPYYYGIWSRDQVQKAKEKGFDYVSVNPYLGQGGVPAHVPMDQIDEVLDAAIRQGFVYKADTLKELAALIGVKPNTLEKTVETYNQYCKTGVDEEFGKDAKYLATIGAGPYYAVTGCAYPYGSGGGLDVDAQLRVLGHDGKTPIGGLYAGGSDSLGVLLTNEKNYISYGGVAQGWVVTSGRVGGKNAALYAMAQK